MSPSGPISIMHEGREHLAIPPNTLVFYVDDSGDERLNDQNNQLFAFGGVACVTESHIELARTWQAMKSGTFRQVKGPFTLRPISGRAGFRSTNALPFSLRSRTGGLGVLERLSLARRSFAWTESYRWVV
jgi:hypothetical protein